MFNYRECNQYKKEPSSALQYSNCSHSTYDYRSSLTVMLQGSHAYSLLWCGAVRTGGCLHCVGGRRQRLVRLRDPHGESSWRGGWALQPRAQEWDGVAGRVQARLGVTAPRPGELFLSFQDFRKYFGRVDLVSLNPLRMEINLSGGRPARRFRLQQLRGEWGGPGGGEPQHHFRLSNCRAGSDRCALVISLAQDPAGKRLLSIGFRVYLVQESRAGTPLDQQ